MGKEQSLIGYAQRVKQEVFEPNVGWVEVSLSVASLALGITVGNLDKLKSRGKMFVVEPTDHKTVLMSLEPQASQRVRDLWQEMLDSLERGRSVASETVKEYRTTYFKSQGEKGLTDSDKELYQIHLQMLWVMIPKGSQREMAEISPDNVWKSMQIV